MNPLRTAILGCGGFAHRHADICRQLPEELQLVAFCDRNRPKGEAYSRQYTGGRATVYTDHRELLAGIPLDLLIICLPPYGHSDEVELAAARGIHLLVEKPIALTSAHAWRMVAAAEAAGIQTQVGFMYRFGAAVEKLRELIDSGEAGPLGLMSGRYFCNALHAGWWRDRTRSGGQLVEQVIHLYDLVRYFGGDPLTVYSRQANLFHRDVPGYTAEDVSASIVTFPSGGLGVICATNNAIPGRWINDYRVVTHRITADFTDANRAIFHFTADLDRPPLVVDSDRDFRRAQTEDLVRAIRQGGETRTPLREGARSLDLVLAAVRAGEAAAEVAL